MVLLKQTDNLAFSSRVVSFETGLAKYAALIETDSIEREEIFVDFQTRDHFRGTLNCFVP